MTKGHNVTKQTGYGTIETRKWTLETGEKSDSQLLHFLGLKEETDLRKKPVHSSSTLVKIGQRGDTKSVK